MFQISKAKKFDDVLRLPKYSHVSMGVIHPRHKSKSSSSLEPVKDLTVVSRPAKIMQFPRSSTREKPPSHKQLPDHLYRPPTEVLQTVTAADLVERKRRAEMEFQYNRGHRMKQQRAASHVEQEKQKKRQSKENYKQFFRALKRVYDEMETDTDILPGLPDSVSPNLSATPRPTSQASFLLGSEMSISNQMRVLYCRVMKRDRRANPPPDTMILDEFREFIRALDLPYAENEDAVNELFNQLDKNREASVQMEILNDQFMRFVRQQETLGGVLNPKNLKKANQEFQRNIQNWRKKTAYRQKMDKKLFDRQKAAISMLKVYKDSFNLDKEEAEQCLLQFYDFLEDKDLKMKSSKVLMGFFERSVPDTPIIELNDLRRAFETEVAQFNAQLRLLGDFVEQIKSECVLNQHFFNFFDVPDLIIKRKFTPKEHESVVKFLNKVRKGYIVAKLQLPGKEGIDQSRIHRESALQDYEISDDDLVPLALLDETLQQKKAKFARRKTQVNSFLHKCHQVIQMKIKKLNVEHTRTVKTFENNIFVNFLSTSIEDILRSGFIYSYKIRILTSVLQKSQFRMAKDLAAKFKEILGIKEEDKDFQEAFERELGRNFAPPGTVVSDSTSVGTKSLTQAVQHISGTHTPAPGITGDDSALEGVIGEGGTTLLGHAPRSNMGEIDEEMKDLISGLNPQKEPQRVLTMDETSGIMDVSPRKPFESGREGGGGHGLAALSQQAEKKEEEEGAEDEYEKFMEEERITEQERKRREEEAERKKYIYRDQGGKEYNPVKRFGNITEDYLLYGRATSSYGAHLPTDYYHGFVKENVPKKDKKWFIRPHHVEVLTMHPMSAKDDVLNTRYYSYYNANEDRRSPEEKSNEDAVKYLEQNLQKLKAELEFVKQHRQANPGQGKGGAMTFGESQAFIHPELGVGGIPDFEQKTKEIPNKTKTGLIVSAYEGILYKLRREEKSMLNNIRHKEIEVNRPPQDRWYEIKSKDFSKELYRNRMSLKPNNENMHYLNELRVPDLY